MLAREGSKRLPGKNCLYWYGKPLWWHAVHVARHAESVGHLRVVTDMKDVTGTLWPKIGDGRDAPFAVHHPMPDAHTSIEGVNWWREHVGLEASYVLLIQCTNPFINPADLDLLATLAFADGLPTEVWALGSRGRPNGMAWVIPPMATDTIAKRFVEPSVWGVDIDEREDYEAALTLAKETGYRP